MTKVNILIILFVSNGQVVAPFTFSVSIGQVHIGAAEPHLLAAGLRLVRHLTLHVGGVTAVSHHITVVTETTQIIHLLTCCHHLDWCCRRRSLQA